MTKKQRDKQEREYANEMRDIHEKMKRDLKSLWIQGRSRWEVSVTDEERKELKSLLIRLRT